MQTKRFFAEQILRELQDDHRNIDFKIDEREVFLRLDAVVNELATQNYFDNWKLTGQGVDEQFITTWEPVVVVDDDEPEGMPSELTLPASYAALPRNRGIDEIYPLKFNKENQSAVIVMSHADYRMYANNPARGMEGRLFGYLSGNKLIFGTCDVARKYGKNFGVRLVVRDSSQIGNDESYPIPADKQQSVVDACVQWFRDRRKQPTDSVRDNKDQM